jgi:hypothetical protein
VIYLTLKLYRHVVRHASAANRGSFLKPNLKTFLFIFLKQNQKLNLVDLLEAELELGP